MKKFLGIAGLILAGVLLAFCVAGLASKPEYKGSVSFSVSAPLDKVWAVMNDIEGLPKRRPEVKSVEILEKDKAGRPLKWKEGTGGNGFIIFQRADYKPKSRFQVRMGENPFKMEGSWAYDLIPQGQQTQVTITEESRINAFGSRAMMTLMGRDYVLKQEQKYLQEGLK